jgi:hypothetical protein
MTYLEDLIRGETGDNEWKDSKTRLLLLPDPVIPTPRPLWEIGVSGGGLLDSSLGGLSNWTPDLIKA